jgi:hypothetical protein
MESYWTNRTSDVDLVNLWKKMVFDSNMVLAHAVAPCLVTSSFSLALMYNFMCSRASSTAFALCLFIPNLAYPTSEPMLAHTSSHNTNEGDASDHV